MNKYSLYVAAITLCSGGSLFAQYPCSGTSPGTPIPRQYGTSLPAFIYPNDKPQWTKAVYRDVDVRDNENQTFSTIPSASGNKTLATVLLDGIFSKSIKAYAPVDDKFSAELSREDIIALISNNSKNANSGFNAQQVTRYRIKEVWTFWEREHRMTVSITSIAPLGAVPGPNSPSMDQPLFWINFADSRDYLSKFSAVVPNDPKPYTITEYLEGRQFKSRIVKVSHEYNYQNSWPLKDIGNVSIK